MVRNYDDEDEDTTVNPHARVLAHTRTHTSTPGGHDELARTPTHTNTHAGGHDEETRRKEAAEVS